MLCDVLLSIYNVYLDDDLHLFFIIINSLFDVFLFTITGVQQTHFVCHNKRNKRVVSNKWCTKNQRPIPERQECYLQPCPPR
jgi:hypothetical protein